MIDLFRFSPSRLALSYVGLSVLVLALFAIPLWYAWSVNISTFREYVHADDVQRMVDVFEREGATGLALAIESETSSYPRDQIVVLADPSKSRVAGNLSAWPAEVPNAPGTYGLVINRPQSSMRVVASHIPLPGGYHLLLGRESARFQSLVDYFWLDLAGATVIVIVLGAVVGWLIRRALLFEVQQMGSTAKAIVAGDLSRRLATRRSPHALAALAQTVNDMLEQLARKNMQLGEEIATRRHAEQALQRTHQHLEQLVKQRTAELQQSNESLRRSEAYLAEAQQLAGVGSFGIKIENRELVCSEETMRIAAFEPGSRPTLEDALQRVHPEDRARIEATLEQGLQDRSLLEYEHRLLLPDGSTKHVRVVAHTIQDASNAAEFVGAVVDITAQKNSQDALQQQRTYLDELFELAPDAVVLVTLNSPRILRINREFTRMFGYTPEEAVGQHLRDLIVPDDAEPTILPEDPDLLAGRKIEREVVRRRKNGARFHAHITGKRIQLSEDDDAAYLIFRDITERKHAETLLAGEKRLLEVIAKGAPLATTLDALCRLAEDVDRDSLVSILLVDRNRGRFRHGAGPSLADGYIVQIDGYPVDVGVGPCGAAACLGEQVIASDLATDERWSPEYRALAAAYGLRACWSTPIMSPDARVLGTFAILSHEPRTPTPEQKGRIEQLTHLACIAIERAEASEALRRSEEGYALAMEASGEGHWDWDIVADEYHASPRMLELYGFAPGTTFKNRADFLARFPFHPEDRERWDKAIAAHFAGETARFDIEIRMLPHGEARWIHLTGVLSRDAAGKPVRWTGSVADITERKGAEDALRLSEQRYALAMEATGDGHWDWDIPSDKIYVSPLLLDICGLPPDTAFAGWSEWVDRFPFYPGERARYEGAVAEHFAGKTRRLDVDVRITPRGETRWVHLTGRCSRDASGKPIRWAGSVTDITARKAVAEELRARQEMLDLAQKAARAVAFEWRVGAEGENRWSPDLEAMYGIAAGSYDGTFESWKKLVHPDDWPKVREAIKAAQESGDVSTEYRVVHSGGAVRWLQAKGRMFFDPEGKPTRIVGFMLDVTDRHLAEQELQRMEHQLRQAQRLEAMGTLAGGIAHDFNNLLGAILGYGEMALRDAPEGSRLRRDVENIMIAGERGRALVDRVLAFSRSGVGERVAVHVEDAVRETLALFAAKLPRAIVVEQQLDAGGVAVMGDPTQIHQVLMNLLTNAAQAMPTGGMLRVLLQRVRVRVPHPVTTGSLGPRDYVLLDVADTGSGIPREILERIFDPFFTTKEVGVGTGLGLSLVHGIVIGLGGAIDVATTVGKGSVFKVYLPISGDLASGSKPSRGAQSLARGSGHGRVLIVDDEDALVRLATETLTDVGYTAVGFTASAAALDAFRADAGQFDAVITDESMPGKSGCELIREVRAIDPTIPILLVSGYLSAAVVERARQAGASEVLKKPLSANDLATALDGALRAARARAAPDMAAAPVPATVGKRRRATTATRSRGRPATR